MFGLALKLKHSYNRRHDAEDILQEHIERCENSPSGLVYYSTDITVNRKKLGLVDRVVLYSSVAGIFATAELERGELYGDSQPNGFVPDDSAQYSPERYVDEERKMWLLLRNLRRVEPDALEGFHMTSKPDVSVQEKCQTRDRTNHFYFD